MSMTSGFTAALAIVLIAIGLALPVQAGDRIPVREGWAVHQTQMTYEEMLGRMKPAISAEKMGLVTQAGPTGVAKKRGITIPGSRVFGVFNNKFAVRAIRTSISAMIEAPIRMYVTENPDGTATLSYKTPSHVFAPYFDEGGAELRQIAAELDAIFARIAKGVTG
ncbi:MAG: DUF302 domain-containing protein [Pseudomonadota bacterium]